MCLWLERINAVVFEKDVINLYEPPHDKTNKVSVCPVKTQISLGIHPVWSETSLSTWRKLGFLATHWVHIEDSDQTWRMPRLIWVFAGHTLTLLVLSCRGSNVINLNRETSPMHCHTSDYSGMGNYTGTCNMSCLSYCCQIWACARRKTRKWTVRPAKTDQPEHPPSLISLCCRHNLRNLGSLVITYWAHSEGSDQTADVILMVLSCCCSYYFHVIAWITLIFFTYVFIYYSMSAMLYFSVLTNSSLFWLL